MLKFAFLLIVSLLSQTAFAQNSSATNKSGKRKPAKPAPSYLADYTGAIGCRIPMGPQKFEEFKSSVSMQLTDENKIIIATQSIFSYCLLCSQ
ncbi:MAG TPA: hypothetical protein VJY62_04555 [Bacteroidia bacterium]|nr:hypothetical protein [Bacteroidia bacterium]